MKIIKNKETSLLLKSFLLNNQDYLSISVMHYFDFNNPDVALSEQAMFKESSKELGKTILDYAMAKPRAEVLVCGSCHNPLPNEGVSHVELKVSSLEKQLFVFGEREWEMGSITRALPFKTMPLDYAHAIPIDEKHLPHIEDPKHLTSSQGEVKNPAGFMPLDMFRESNMKKLGTYDAAWKRELWPGFAHDMDYSFFNVAPKDQQFEEFFEGGESIKLTNMHPEHPVISSNIPQTSMRCFVTKLHEDKDDEFVEVKLQRDTLWLFPEIQRGIVIFRGTIAIEDEIYSNLKYLNLKPVESGEPPKSLEEYYELQKKELKKSVELDETPFEKADAQMKEMKKTMFDMPRDIKATVEETEGKRPFLKRTPAEKLERSHAMIDKAIAQIDASKIKSQEMKAKFGHISKVDTSSLDATKKELLESKEKLSQMSANVEKVLAMGEAKKDEAKAEIEKIKNDPNVPDEIKEKLDLSFFEPKVKLWSDYAFDFVCDGVKRLEKAPQELHQLRHLGLAQRTITRSWVGYNSEAKTIKASEWNLKSEENIELPKGFVTARFHEATLKSLRIEKTLVLGSDASYELFLSEENYNFPLFYLTNDLEAHLCDQEAFDICNSLVCDDISSVGDEAKEALKSASIIFYLQKDGVIEKLPHAKKFDCGEYKNLFELHQNSIEIREQIIENLPKNISDTLPIKRDESPKASIARVKGASDKVKADLKAKGETIKKDLFQKRDEALAKANEALKEQGMDPIKIEPHEPLQGFIKASDVEENMNKAIDALKKNNGISKVDLKEQIAKLEKVKEEAVGLAKDAEKTFAHGKQKIDEAKEKEKDPFPQWAKDRMKKAGIDPKNPHDKLTREKVIAYHADGKSFKGKSLSELDLSELDLTGIDLTQANLTKTNFKNSNLSEAKLKQAVCTQTDFTHTNLSNAQVSSTTFRKSILKKAILNGLVAKKAFFEGVILKDVKCSEANLHSAIFKDVKIENSSFNDCNLSSANFLNSSLKHSSFDNSKMNQLLFSKSVMSDCELQYIDSNKMLFNKSKVTNCNFSQSKLHNMRILKSSRFKECDLSRCNMDKSSIFEGSLEMCNLQQTTLNKSLIKKSEISECDFRGVVAKQGRFEYSKFDNCNFKGINLFKGSLRRMDIKICDFSHSNLYAVEMYKTKLFEVNFSGANLTRSNLEDRVELIYD